jgi:hypothetical protein
MRTVIAILVFGSLIPACAELQKLNPGAPTDPAAAGNVSNVNYLDDHYKGRSYAGEVMFALPPPADRVVVHDTQNFDAVFRDDGAYQRFVAGVGEASRRFPRPAQGPPLDRERFLASEVTRTVVRVFDGLPSRPEPYGARPHLRDETRERHITWNGERAQCDAWVPARAAVETGGLTVRYLLVLDGLELGLRDGVVWSSMGEWSPGRPGMAPTYKPGYSMSDPNAKPEHHAVFARARYLIYDYGENKVAACGTALGKAPFTDGQARRIDWDLAFVELAKAIPSPF